MLDDAPPPLKRSWHYPPPPEALEYFVHPGDHQGLQRPGLDAEGRTLVSNGYLAIRFETFFPDIPPPTKRLTLAIKNAPWSRFEPLEQNPKPWRPLEDAIPQLFKHGPKPIWERTRTRYHIRRAPSVRVGHGATTSLALLQLITRLPRAEIFTGTDMHSPLFVRFNRGRAILAPWDGYEHPAFTIFRPKTDPLTGKSYH